MKTAFLTFVFLTLTLIALAAPDIKAVSNNGNWTTSTSWNLNRIPSSADTIDIPAGKTIIVNSIIVLNNVYIRINGTLQFQNFLSSLVLDNASTIIVNVGGKILGTPGQNFIGLGSNTIFSGTTVSGPSLANSGTGNGFVSFVPLPVKFTSFTVSNNNHSALIQWSTSEELNAKDFTIEKSIDGKNWNAVSIIKAVGNSGNENDYSYSDDNINASVLYYRIKETDITGELTYTSIKTIKADQSNQLNIAISSIGNGKVLIQFSSQIKGSVFIQYISLSGQVVTKQEISNPIGQQILSNNTLRGNYFISITNAEGIHIAKQIIL